MAQLVAEFPSADKSRMYRETCKAKRRIVELLNGRKFLDGTNVLVSSTVDEMEEDEEDEDDEEEEEDGVFVVSARMARPRTPLVFVPAWSEDGSWTAYSSGGSQRAFSSVDHVDGSPCGPSDSKPALHMDPNPRESVETKIDAKLEVFDTQIQELTKLASRWDHQHAKMAQLVSEASPTATGLATSLSHLVVALCLFLSLVLLGLVLCFRRRR